MQESQEKLYLETRYKVYSQKPITKSGRTKPKLNIMESEDYIKAYEYYYSLSHKVDETLIYLEELTIIRDNEIADIDIIHREYISHKNQYIFHKN